MAKPQPWKIEGAGLDREVSPGRVAFAVAQDEAQRLAEADTLLVKDETGEIQAVVERQADGTVLTRSA